MIIFACIFTPKFAIASETPNIAVYVTSGRTDDRRWGENRALATFIQDALIRSGRYRAIERSVRFVEQLELEQAKQHSGAVDENDIRRLGMQAGVQFLCIANITRVLDAYQISARIVDIETARVVTMGVTLSGMESAEDLRRASEDVVGKMLEVLPTPDRSHRRNRREFPNSSASDTTTLMPPSVPQDTQQTTASQSVQPVSGGSSFTDSRDGQSYRTAEIGSLTWMAENLNFETGNSWCYDNNSSNCSKYGRLYDWNTAKSVCPSGWRLPARHDWDDLGQAAGGTKRPDLKGNIDWLNAGSKLKSRSYWINNGNVTDDFGFSGLAGGTRGTDGVFGMFAFVDSFGLWWTAAESSGNNAYYRGIGNDFNDLNEETIDKSFGLSVRCVCDRPGFSAPVAPQPVSQVKESGAESRPKPKTKKPNFYYSIYDTRILGIQAGYGTALNAEVTLTLGVGHQRADFGLAYWPIYEGGEFNILYNLQTNSSPVNLYAGIGCAFLLYYDHDNKYYMDGTFDMDLGLGIQIGTELTIERTVLGVYTRTMWYYENTLSTVGVRVGFKF